MPKWDPKLISTLKAENHLNSSRLAFSWLSGVEVGSKNQSKIDLKMESKMECILASIFERCCWIFGAKLGGKIDQKSIKNQIAKTKQKTKPFGTRLGPSSGCQDGRDVLRPNPTGPNATRRDENPFSGGRQGRRTSRKNT